MLEEKPVCYVVRKFEPKDRPAVRRICYETALMGETAGVFFTDREILADVLIKYFTDHEPASLFVADVAGEVIGYLAAAANEGLMRRVFREKIAFSVFLKSCRRGTWFRAKNLFFLWRLFLSWVRKEFSFLDSGLVKDYPAVLHINVKKGFRAGGCGRRLMEAALEFLGSRGVRGVHLATMSEEALHFFQKHGFHILGRGRRSYLRHVLGRDVSVYLLGKALDVHG